MDSDQDVIPPFQGAAKPLKITVEEVRKASTATTTEIRHITSRQRHSRYL